MKTTKKLFGVGCMNLLFSSLYARLKIHIHKYTDFDVTLNLLYPGLGPAATILGY